MSLIRPTFLENLCIQLYNLDPERRFYYLELVTQAEAIFRILQYHEKISEMKKLILTEIEIPLMSRFKSVIHAYYNQKFMERRMAYTKVGDYLDYKEVTRFEIMERLEIVKDWIFIEITKITPHIRFTRYSQITT